MYLTEQQGKLFANAAILWLLYAIRVICVGGYQQTILSDGCCMRYVSCVGGDQATEPQRMYTNWACLHWN